MSKNKNIVTFDEKQANIITNLMSNKNNTNRNLYFP